MKPRLLRLWLEYDGASFLGWQRQINLPTVQGALEKALCLFTHEAVMALDVRAAGRTDAGVHAQGQVVTFHTVSSLESRRFTPALNHFLPPQIRVHACEEAPNLFSARHSACGKSYQYTLYVAPQPSALMRGRAWHLRQKLDVAAMQEAACCLVGSNDFESFRSAHCDAPHARRELWAVKVEPQQALASGTLLQITLVGDAFCRHMCRIIVGTLVEVGQGRRKAATLPQILAARCRTQAGETAPAHGLTLLRVHYPEALQFADFRENLQF